MASDAGSRDPQWPAFLGRWLGLALLLHGLAAGFSEGFYHPDEHWQVIEFTGCYLGESPCEDLPWEYPARMRAWAQPVFYSLLARLFAAFGVETPNGVATGLRFVSAGIGWLALLALALCVPRWIRNAGLRRWAVIGLSALWCLPYLHARTSAENFGGSFLALGLAALCGLRPRAATSLAAGLLLGLSFEFRFQMGFAVAGLCCWGLLVERWPLGRLLGVAAGIAGAVAAGTALDAHAYGEWTFAPWNYLQQNVLAGRMYDYGDPEPWWYYLNRAAFVLAPVSCVLLGLVGVACVRRWRSPLVWALVPFVAAHAATSHQSLRFLFPVVPLVPLLAALALDGWRPRGVEVGALLQRPLWRGFALLCLGVNLVALCVVTLRPPNTPTGFHRWIERHAPRPLELHVSGQPPYPRSLVMNFYWPDWLTLVDSSPGRFEAQLAASEGPLHLLDDRAALPTPFLREHCALVHASHPSWLRESSWLPSLMGRVRFRNLYRCEARLPMLEP